MILRSFALAVLLLALSAATAVADVRYAGPSGSSGSAPCAEKSTPCSLTTALTGTSTGDKIELAPGDYYESSTVTISGAVDVYGEPGKPRPVIRSTAGSTAVSVSNAAATLSYVEVTHTGISHAVSSSGTVSRSRFITTNSVSISSACGLFGGSFDNSICVSFGGDGFRASSEGAGAGAPITVRNSVGVSFSSDSDNCGVGLIHSGSYARTYNFINSVLDASINGACVNATETSAITLNLINTNYRAALSNEAGGAQAVINMTNSSVAPPGFVNKAGQDFHPAAGSPLINAGLNDPANGAVDFDGNSRTIDGTTDIGAFESSPPPVVAPPAPTTTISSKLKSKSKSFTAAKSGAVFQVSTKQPKKKRRKPTVGTLITFTLSQADDVKFTLDRAYVGRKSGSKCVRTTRSNKSKKRCTYYKQMRGTETATGLVAGSNTIWWTGRWQKKKLSPGSYALRGTPIKASTGNEPGVLNPRPVKILPK